jgi:hypothetical protein
MSLNHRTDQISLLLVSAAVTMGGVAIWCMVSNDNIHLDHVALECSPSGLSTSISLEIELSVLPTENPRCK